MTRFIELMALARSLGFVFITGLILAGLFFIQPAKAEMVVEPDKLLIGDDYSVFPVNEGRARVCREACAQDKRCEAWTFIRPNRTGVGQCRLKRTVAPGFKNNCCVSGYKTGNEYDDYDQQPAGQRKAKRCRDYSEQAVAYNEINIESRCGYRGRAWHSNAKRHFRHCMRIGRKERALELNGQKKAVQACEQEVGFSKRTRCDHYARIAVNQERSRAKAGCSYKNRDRWSVNYKTHLNWCLQAPKREAWIENETREKSLRRCFAFEGPRSGPCHEYAQSAINHFRKNIQKGCDLHGARWHNNYRRHFRWCKQVSSKARRREISQRRLTLKTCRLFGKLGIQWK